MNDGSVIHVSVLKIAIWIKVGCCLKMRVSRCQWETDRIKAHEVLAYPLQSQLGAFRFEKLENLRQKIIWKQKTRKRWSGVGAATTPRDKKPAAPTEEARRILVINPDIPQDQPHPSDLLDYPCPCYLIPMDISPCPSNYYQQQLYNHWQRLQTERGDHCFHGHLAAISPPPQVKYSHRSTLSGLEFEFYIEISV